MGGRIYPYLAGDRDDPFVYAAFPLVAGALFDYGQLSDFCGESKARHPFGGVAAVISVADLVRDSG